MIEESNELVRERILNTAASIIKSHGADAATTRAVADGAAVQAPTIYRLFGDKRGLLDAVAEREMAAYIAKKGKRAPHPDPVEELRLGWDGHVSFGLANPGLFSIMVENSSSPATTAGLKILSERVHAIAKDGRLSTTEERAVSMLHAACTGVILTLQANQLDTTDLSNLTREAIISSITLDQTKKPDLNKRTAATTLRASLSDATILSPGEKMLLEELLIKLANN